MVLETNWDFVKADNHKMTTYSFEYEKELEQVSKSNSSQQSLMQTSRCNVFRRISSIL